VPVWRACTRCHGAGYTGAFWCERCDGKGRVEREVIVPLRVPPWVQAGAELEVPLEGYGIRNLWLRIHIHVR
jgi:DnaJ-class molecular chaperone